VTSLSPKAILLVETPEMLLHLDKAAIDRFSIHMRDIVVPKLALRPMAEEKEAFTLKFQKE